MSVSAVQEAQQSQTSAGGPTKPELGGARPGAALFSAFDRSSFVDSYTHLRSYGKCILIVP